MKSTGKKKRGRLTAEALREKMDDFYKSLDVDDRPENIRKLVEKNGEILRKIDALADVLLRTAKELEGSKEERALLRSILDELKALKKMRESVLSETASKLEMVGSIRAEIEELENRLSDLKELKRAVSELKEMLETSREESRLGELDGRVSGLENLKDDIAEIKELLKASKDGGRHEQRLSELEKEVESLSAAVDAVQRAVSGSIDGRKRALEILVQRAECILEAIDQIRSARPGIEEERLQRLQESVRTMLRAVSETFSRISEQEMKELELFSDYVRHIDRRVGELEKMLEGDPEPPTLRAVKDELEDISKKLAVLTDIMRVNAPLLKAHSGDVAELIARFQALDDKLSEIEENVKNASFALVELQRAVEKEIDVLRGKVLDSLRELRERRDSDVVNAYRALKDSLSVVHAELAGVLELVKKHDVTANLESISRRIDELSAAMDEDRCDYTAVIRELADVEEELAKVTSVISEADVRAIKSRLEEVSRAVDEISKEIRGAEAVLSEDDLKEVIRDLEALRAHIRRLRDAGLKEELYRVHGRVKDLRATIESSAGAIKDGKVQHAVVIVHHSETRKLVAPVADVSSAVVAVAAAKENTARKIKRKAMDLAKKSGSSHAHVVASYSDKLVRTAKAIRDVDRLIVKIQKKVEKIEAEIASKQGWFVRSAVKNIWNSF